MTLIDPAGMVPAEGDAQSVLDARDQLAAAMLRQYDESLDRSRLVGAYVTCALAGHDIGIEKLLDKVL